MNYIETFLNLMNKGGPIMWVIFIVSWIALILLVERVLRISAWKRQAIKAQQQYKNDRNYRPPSPNGIKTSPIAVLYHALHWDDIHDRVELDKQINIQLTEMVPRLEGVLPTIAIIGSLLPMLGLLGTVMGMIHVFEAIAVHGTGDPQRMADGISQALLTTASGLIIAIPVIFLHHLLSRRLHLVIALTEQSIHMLRGQNMFDVANTDEK